MPPAVAASSEVSVLTGLVPPESLESSVDLDPVVTLNKPSSESSKDKW